MTTELLLIASGMFTTAGFVIALFLWMRTARLARKLEEADYKIAFLQEHIDMLENPPPSDVKRGGFGSSAAKHAPRTGRRKINLDDDTQ
jgi:hypothetical protein